MRVSDIMTTNLFTLYDDQTLEMAEDVMNWHRIRHIPVIDRNRHLVGLVTHRDLLRGAVSCFANPAPGHQRELNAHIPVRDLMRTRVITVAPDTTLEMAAEILIDEKVGCLPVVEGEKLVGIVTEADFVALVQALLQKKLTLQKGATP
jgi:CBS domain-containing membrane protein